MICGMKRATSILSGAAAAHGRRVADDRERAGGPVAGTRGGQGRLGGVAVRRRHHGRRRRWPA